MPTEKDEAATREQAEQAPAEQARPVQDLKALRESKGIRLKDIFEVTRITIINLEAIESGRFGVLPAPVIARSFIRTYARVIGADEEQLLERYNRFLQESQGPPPEVAAAPPKGKPSRKVIVTIFGLLAALLIAVAVLLLREPATAPPEPPPVAPAARPADTVPPAPAASAQPPAAPGEPAPPAAAPAPASPPPAPAAAPASPTAASPPAPSPAPPAATPPAPPPAAAAAGAGTGYTLVIEARDYTWIRLSEDQGQRYQVMLKPGERLERRANRSFDIDVGNAGGTQLIFQGKSLGPLGSPGQVVHLRLP